MSDGCNPSPPGSNGGGNPAGAPNKPCNSPCRLRLDELSFKDNHVVEKDTAGNFVAPEWKHGRSASDNAPICYTRNTSLKVDVKFVVTQQPCSSETVSIEGKTNVGGTDITFTASLNVSPSATELTTTITGNPALPNEVNCIDTLDITWSYNKSGASANSAGASNNVLYITLGDPTGTPAYWTLLDISCRAATSATTENELVNKTYSAFQTRALTRKRDNKGLAYWKPANSTTATNTALLLSSAIGSGQCGSWAEFLIDMLKAHNVTTAIKVLIVVTKSDLLNATSGFLVKDWAFTGSGAQPSPWPYIISVDCNNQPGVAGQRNPEPPPSFYNHFIVQYGGQFYDPSYGSSVFSTQLNWENNSIDGRYKHATITINNKTYQVTLAGYRKSTHTSTKIVEFWNIATNTKI